MKGRASTILPEMLDQTPIPRVDPAEVIVPSPTAIDFVPSKSSWHKDYLTIRIHINNRMKVEFYFSKILAIPSRPTLLTPKIV